ncbi:MAG: YgjP-like metallopeptidase domain-containing protein [Bacilli bacterium]
MTIKINENNVNIIFIKKNVKRTFIKINHKKDVIITSPTKLTNKEILDIINIHEKWISKQIAKIKTIIIDNDNYLIFGKNYKIICRDTMKNDYEIVNDIIFYKGNGLETLSNDLMEEVEKKFFDILTLYNFTFIPKVIIKDMKSKWGVCHYKTKKVVINKAFIHLPIALLEYVIHHELNHFIVPNHSVDFYNELYKHLPNHRDLQKRLKKYSYILRS